MNVKKLVLAWVVGFVVMFLLAGLWHMVVASSLYGEGTVDPVMGLIAAGYAVLALLMSYAYPIGFKGGSAISEGLRFGALIGLVWVLPHSLVMTGVEGGEMGILFIDAGWHIVEQGVGGILIALIYGSGDSDAE